MSSTEKQHFGLVRELHEAPVRVGRYLLHRQIARGGMATIHLARLLGDHGFSRLVAAKRLHPEFAEDDEFVAMFLNEARLASCIRHRNVVPVLDVVTAGEEVILVQEYVHGVPLQWLARYVQQAGARMPVDVAVAVACQVLSGLAAAHDTMDELGRPLSVVHRDVSPQNILVAVDGSARLLDFGVAKATLSAHVTREGTYKGKLAYSAPEQLRGRATPQSDLYALAVVLWELLAGHRMHRTGKTAPELIAAVVQGHLPALGDALAAQPCVSAREAERRQKVEALGWIVQKGLAVDLEVRWQTAAAMEAALSEVVPPALPSTVAAWLKVAGGAFLERRERLLAAEEGSWQRYRAARPPTESGPIEASSYVKERVADPLAELSAAPLDVVALPSPVQADRDRRLLGALFVVVLALAAALGLRAEQPASDGLAPAPPTTLEGPAPPVVAPALSEPPREAEPGALPPRAQQGERTRASARASGERARSEPRTRARRDVSPASPHPGRDERAHADEDDCSTPYYFDGAKKIVKPRCL